MIAEKTADAIKGRKLTPFEPPTRVAGYGNAGGRNSNNQYLAHRQQVQYHSNQQHHHEHQQMNHYTMQQASMSYEKSPQLDYAASTSHNQEQQHHHLLPEPDYHQVQAPAPLQMLRPQIAYPPPLLQMNPETNSRKSLEGFANNSSSSLDEQLHREHLEFMLNRYGGSMVAENLIKRVTKV